MTKQEFQKYVSEQYAACKVYGPAVRDKASEVRKYDTQLAALLERDADNSQAIVKHIMSKCEER